LKKIEISKKKKSTSNQHTSSTFYEDIFIYFILYKCVQIYLFHVVSWQPFSYIWSTSSHSDKQICVLFHRLTCLKMLKHQLYLKQHTWG